MRRRMVIGAIGVVIGLATYVLLQPRKGTLEWHEREYWALHSEDEMLPQDTARMKIHEAELIKHGRLAARTILISNTSPGQAAISAMTNLAPFSDDRLVDAYFPATNAIRLVTRTNNAAARLARWEQLIHQADVLETK